MALKFNFNSSVCSVAYSAPIWEKNLINKYFGLKFQIYDLTQQIWKCVVHGI